MAILRLPRGVEGEFRLAGLDPLQFGTFTLDGHAMCLSSAVPGGCGLPDTTPNGSLCRKADGSWEVAAASAGDFLSRQGAD